MLDCYPTNFECVDTETQDTLFKVEMFDEYVANVDVITCVTVESWDELSVKIRECLVAMNLKVL